MAKGDFQEYLCRPYCMFFREGVKEEMSCRAALILEGLVSREGVDLGKMPPLKKRPGLWERLKAVLGARVCGTCPFFSDDCDFQATKRVDDAEPCGGFILLAHLWENRLIKPADLE